MLDYKDLRVAEAQADYGSFKDSVRAPIHRWFMYPAGFSYRLVESKIEEYSLGARSTILDPFVGCGTTSLTAKEKGVNSIGIEAHPFVHWVTSTKLFWDYDYDALREAIADSHKRSAAADLDALSARIDAGEFPDLVVKCFSNDNLPKLLAIRESIAELRGVPEIRDFLNLALTSTLRIVASAGTGWPYIAPSKYHSKTVKRDAFTEFKKQVQSMYEDLIYVRSTSPSIKTTHTLILGDARQPFPGVKQEFVDLVVTSPPYLNNYDYADRTRLELYFFGWASSWSDITEQVRDKLMMAATTQVTRTSDRQTSLSDEIREASPRVYERLSTVIRELSQVRLTKGGKKNYDIMVAGYFNDIFQVLQQVYRVLKQGSDFILVLGDSAPYGVYIPTDFVIAELALCCGFKAYQVEMLRRRGDKWSANTQRHKVALRESIVTIGK
ncbi:MAG: DNA methyltransferase [Chloroflexota bacterium]|nr:DNA methyltransferase [Chloroflexota bacterium]